MFVKNSAVIDNKIKASVGDSVNKTSDITVINKYRELPVRKVDIDVTFLLIMKIMQFLK